MNNIIKLLDLEDTDIIVSNIKVEGTQKFITLETAVTPHYCPSCGFRMHFEGSSPEKSPIQYFKMDTN